MRFLAITLALFLIAASAVALDRDTNKGALKSVEAGEVKQDTEKTVKKEKKTPKWPRPYKSTEEICAEKISLPR
jgi:hypothetical protein